MVYSRGMSEEARERRRRASLLGIEGTGAGATLEEHGRQGRAADEHQRGNQGRSLRHFASLRSTVSRYYQYRQLYCQDWICTKKHWLPQIAAGDKFVAFCLSEKFAGSDAQGLSVRAYEDGDDYVICGEKKWTTNGGVADVYSVFAVTDPEAFGLPKSHLSSRYIFAQERDFMVYPNNFNRFVRYLEGTFQHGGISMEEMLVPLVHLRPR